MNDEEYTAEVVKAAYRWDAANSLHPIREIKLTWIEAKALYFSTRPEHPKEDWTPSPSDAVFGRRIKYVQAASASSLYPFYRARQEEPTVSAWDRQEGGNHYKQFAIQPGQFIAKNNLGCTRATSSSTPRVRRSRGLRWRT